MWLVERARCIEHTPHRARKEIQGVRKITKDIHYVWIAFSLKEMATSTTRESSSKKGGFARQTSTTIFKGGLFIFGATNPIRREWPKSASQVRWYMLFVNFHVWIAFFAKQYLVSLFWDYKWLILESDLDASGGILCFYHSCSDIIAHDRGPLVFIQEDHLVLSFNMNKDPQSFLSYIKTIHEDIFLSTLKHHDVILCFTLQLISKVHGNMFVTTVHLASTALNLKQHI